MKFTEESPGNHCVFDCKNKDQKSYQFFLKMPFTFLQFSNVKPTSVDSKETHHVLRSRGETSAVLLYWQVEMFVERISNMFPKSKKVSEKERDQFMQWSNRAHKPGGN